MIKIFGAMTLVLALPTMANVAPPVAPASPVVSSMSPDEQAPPFAVKIIPSTPLPVAVRQPLICHSTVETGSLIQRRKQCLTKSQWRYVEEVQDQQNRELFDAQRSKQGCNGPGC